jgi:hypothetical protein
MAKESEKSRHVDRKPDAGDEARNRNTLDKPAEDDGKRAKPRNADVGDLKKDR